MALQIPQSPNALSLLQIPEVKPIGPLDAAAQALGLKAAQSQLATQDLQRQQMQESLQRSQIANKSTDAVRTLLSTKPNASVDELLKAGGPEAIPLIKETLAQRKQEIADAKDRVAQHQSLLSDLGNTALGLKQLPVEQRPAAHQQAIQRMMQTYPEYQNELQQALQSGDSDEQLNQVIATTPAIFKQLELQDKKLTEEQKRNLEHAQQLQAEARARSLDRPPQRNIDPNSPEGIAAAVEKARLSAPYRAAANSTTAEDDVKDTAKGIAEGKISPQISQSVSLRDRTKVSGELERMGYNQAEAERDWKAINKHLSTLNGQQQERLRQAISFTADTLPQIEEAYAEWKRQAGTSGFKVLNKANLAAMKQLPGKPGSAATNLDALISDFTSELGTVYKGGNSSTDESLKLAAKNLSGDWNDQTFSDAVKRLKQSLKIRQNSINISETQGVSPQSPYQPQGDNSNSMDRVRARLGLPTR